MTVRPRRCRAALVAALLVLCLAGTARAAGGGRVALLVGIGEYPFVREPALQLHGAKIDVEQMGLVLQYCGFQTTVLEGKAATSAAVRQALRALSDQAGSGGEVVFYFSGRGSVAYDPKRPQAVRDLEPTLVPYDGRAESAAADLPMSVLEAWAREVTAKEAGVTILLDACYSARASRDLEYRFYKDVPRCVSRPGAPRAALYNGPGILLAATGTTGRAYEWRVDFSSDTWTGAFTDLWTNAAMRRLRAGKPPTFAELMGEIQSFFAARKNYMPGMRPYPPSEQMASALYQRPLFAPAKTAAAPPPPLPAPPPPVKAKVEAVVEKHEEQEKTLRVALDAHAPARGGDDPDAAPLDLKPFQEYAGKHLDRVTILPQYGDRPDRILVVNKTGEGWEVRVQGDELDRFRQPDFRGKDVAGVMQAGLADYLQRQAYVLRLFRLTAEAADQTLKATWSARSEKPRYRRGDAFAYLVETPLEGLLYILDQDQSDGIVQMVWPLRQEWGNQRPAGKFRLPGELALKIDDGQSTGRTQTRALLVVPSEGMPLPSLQPPGGRWESDALYSRAELAHLRALLHALERKQARWSAVTFDYEVTE